MQILFGFWLICAFTLIGIAYMRYDRLRRNLWATKARDSFNTEPISVLIAAYNEAQNLKQFLPEVLNQNHPNFEVVVVNDGSTDDTRLVLENFKKKNPNLIVVNQEHSGKKKAISNAVAVARNEYLAFTDADCKPASNLWLSYLSHRLNKQDLLLGYGALNTENGFVALLSKWETLQTALHYYSAALIGKPYMGVGRNMAYKKSLFKKKKGFSKHEHMFSGDDDLFVASIKANEAKVSVVFQEEAFTYSKAPDSLKQWWKQKRRHNSTAFKYSTVNKLLLGGEGFAQFFLYLFFPVLVLNFTEPVIFIFLMRYVATLVWAMPLAKHFKAQKAFWTFPVWEGSWAIFTAIIHIQNLIFGFRKSW